MDLPHLVRAQKEIAGSCKWIARDPKWLSLTVSLDIDGVTTAGLSLRGAALLNHDDSAVSLQLQYQPVRGKAQHLIRAEWRPLKSHTNSNRGPNEWRFKTIMGSHVHKFADNYLENEKRMFAGSQKSAVPIPESVDSYEKFLEYGRIEFNITNIQRIPVPPWAPRIL